MRLFLPSIFSHAIAAGALGTSFWRSGLPTRFWVLGAMCAVLPDFDVVAFRLGIPYDHMLGHRGLSHSLVFSAAVGVLMVAVFFAGTRWRGHRTRLWLYFFLATASHGVLDAMTSGGHGVAFLAPFSDERFFLPWRPIVVSPLSVSRFFSERGLAVLRSELVWIWLPALTFSLVAIVWRRGKGAPIGRTSV